MTIAWRRLGDVPVDDARPWLIAIARNLPLAERRKQRRASATAAAASLGISQAVKSAASAGWRSRRRSGSRPGLRLIDVRGRSRPPAVDDLIDNRYAKGTEP
jgi:DNA-directed RNA polymerase specialized sigma24 family protein